MYNPSQVTDFINQRINKFQQSCSSSSSNASSDVSSNNSISNRNNSNRSSSHSVSASSSYYYLFQQNCSSSQSSCSRLAAAAAANHHSNVLECGLNTTKFVSASQILILSSIYFVEREWLGALLERSLGNLRPKKPQILIVFHFYFP